MTASNENIVIFEIKSSLLLAVSGHFFKAQSSQNKKIMTALIASLKFADYCSCLVLYFELSYIISVLSPITSQEYS